MKNNFQLKNLKRISGGGLFIEWETTDREGSEIFNETWQKKGTKIQHSDMNAILDRMKPHLFKSLNLFWLKTVMESGELDKSEQKAFETVERILMSGMNAQMEKITINGVSISGAEGKEKVIIKASMLTDNKAKVAVNSPLISMKGSIFGFEEDLKQDIEELAEEAYAYLFENKKAQLDLFDPEVNIRDINSKAI